jgi:hydrogenase 3 maturation protease
MDLLVMCIGNREGGDDAVGPFVSDKLIENGFSNVLDCGTIPENYTSVVKQKAPEKLVIIDAVDMGLSPGEIRIVPKEKIGVMTISTHGIPVSLLIEYLEQDIKKIIFIGIQPDTMSGDMTEKVKKNGIELAKLIINQDFEKIQRY